MQFVPGALAATLASFDARTFRAPPDAWQPTVSTDRATWVEGSGDGLIGDLIREGVTGVSGQVGEAYLRGAVRPEILFPAYVQGVTLAEAFYLAMPTLSWQSIVVGDPLTAPFAARRSTRAEPEEGPDPMTGLPGLFSRRRLSAIAALNRDVPAAALAPVVRAETLLERDDRSGAARALAEAATLAPHLANWLLVIASLQDQAGDYAAAVGTNRAILALQPTNVVALNNLAYALAVHLGKPAEALPFAKRAASLAPKAGTILDTLAWTEHLLGNDEAAAKLLAEAIRLDPRQAEIRLHAAIVYAATGSLDRAAAELEEALRRDPQLASNEDVKQLQSRLAAAKD
jgi:tetratricopeptide (TPR) repeat protein